MGLNFLCSRTEVMRTLWFDTGRTVLIVGAPEDFLEWIDIILPAGSLKAGSPEEAGPYLRDGSFKVVIVWVGDSPDGPEMLRAALSDLSAGSDLWAVLNRGPPYHGDLSHIAPCQKTRKVLGLTPRCDLVPLVVREGA